MALDSPQPASTECQNACEGGGEGSYSDPKWIKIENWLSCISPPRLIGGGGYHEKDTIFITKGVAGCVDSTFYKHGWKILRYANNQVLHNERPKVDGNDTPWSRHCSLYQRTMCGNRYTLSQSRIQVTAMEKELTIVGYLADKPNWITNGKGCYREQDFIVSMGGGMQGNPGYLWTPRI